MKKGRYIKIVSLLVIIILIGVSINFILEKNVIIKSNKQIVKEMNEDTQVTDLNNQINSLNTEHTEYMNYIQTCKTKIATALTSEGVETSEQATLEKMSENISKVLQARTKDATATADNITDGKTAWVNGELIIGNGKDNTNSFESGKQSNSFTDLGTGTSFDIKTLLPNVDYTKLTKDNFIVGISSVPSVSSSGMENIIAGTYGYKVNTDYKVTTTASGITISKSYNSSTGVLTVTAKQTVYTQYLSTTGALSNANTSTQSATCFAYYIP